MTREEILEYFKDINYAYNDCTRYNTLKRMIDELQEPYCDDMGEVSDGYHTFNQLYHQRAVLFATIVNQNKDKSWKSFKHSDGKYCFDSNGEWFIVGIDTPQGSYTYHYAKEYWDMFDCEELECGKEWDGHTEEDITRLLLLQNEPCTDAVSRQAVKNALYNSIRIQELNYPQIIECIDKLPPVKPTEKVWDWIPVDQPPKTSGKYIVTRHFFDNDFVEMTSYSVDLHKVDKYDFPKHKAGWYNYDSEYGHYEVDDIVAWMPSPESYKASPTGEEVDA